MATGILITVDGSEDHLIKPWPKAESWLQGGTNRAKLLGSRLCKNWIEKSRFGKDDACCMYTVYKPDRYFYEPINMSFKVLLWMAAVFFDFGSDLQLAAALVINVLHLCVQVHLKPLGGKEPVLLNALETGARVCVTYLNFAALCVKFLLLSQQYELETTSAQAEDSARFLELQAQIGGVNGVSSALTIVLLLCFTGSLVKSLIFRVKAVVVDRLSNYVRNSRMSSTISPPDAAPEGDVEMQPVPASVAVK